ncbi:hypothetical protein D5086_027842 [Populus alba]|uniref:Uncharacterized protein n=1 Tax=Populus alba TaxID=43335 RepID=A0ACC4AWJ8_POPAL
MIPRITKVVLLPVLWLDHVSYTLLLGNDPQLQFRGLQGPARTSKAKRDPSPTLVQWSSISVQFTNIDLKCYKDLGLVDVDVFEINAIKNYYSLMSHRHSPSSLSDMSPSPDLHITD